MGLLSLKLSAQVAVGGVLQPPTGGVQTASFGTGPKGDQGVQGVAGPSGSVGGVGPQGPGGPPAVNYRGLYAAGTTYAANDWVKASDGMYYFSLAAGNLGNDPVSDSGVHWAPQQPVSVATSLSLGYLSLRKDFALNPSMALGALTTAIQAAITTAIAAGKGIDVGADLWPINAALTISGNLSIRGAGAQEVWDTCAHSNGNAVPGAAPWVTGGGFSQQTAATDILQITGTGACVHLRELVLRFADAIAFSNTGHGLKGVATALDPFGDGLGHESGPQGCRWDNIVVFGHDGNHYAFYTVNAGLIAGTQLRGYGGGGMWIECDSRRSSYGNSTFTSPYFDLFIGGSADGYHLKSRAAGFPGSLALNTYIRPQCNFANLSGVPLVTAFPIAGTNQPSTANQQLWREIGTPQQGVIISPDLEAPGAAFLSSFGSETQIFAPFINNLSQSNTSLGYLAMNNPTGVSNTALGVSALAAATSASGNTAVGASAGVALSTGTNNVAIGYLAGSAITAGTNNVAIGQGAMTASGAGGNNVAVGVSALAGATGANNVAIGSFAADATTGNNNVGVGYAALLSIGTGSSNTAIGTQAGYSDGVTATTNVSNATMIGENAQATTSNVIVLGKATATRPNLIFGGVGAASAFGSGVGVFAIVNAATDPTTNPTGGGILYASGGALKWRGSAGTVTTIAVA